MAFIPLGTADETRLAIVLNRANQVSRHAIPLILQPDHQHQERTHGFV